jgi:peptide/nickel transport system substrate-binding protein
VKRIVGGGGAVTPVLCYRSQFGCPEHAGPDYPYDVARAKALLAEAGFPNGFDVDFFAYRDRTEAEALAGYLAAVGIRANLRILQYAAVRDNVRARKSPLTLQSWGSASINDVSAIIPVFFKHTSDDVARDDEVRDLLARGDGTLDKTARQDAYAKALGLIQSRAYALPLASLPVRHAAKKGLSFTADPDELLRFWEMRWN